MDMLRYRLGVILWLVQSKLDVLLLKVQRALIYDRFRLQMEQLAYDRDDQDYIIGVMHSMPIVFNEWMQIAAIELMKLGLPIDTVRRSLELLYQAHEADRWDRRELRLKLFMRAHVGMLSEEDRDLLAELGIWIPPHVRGPYSIVDYAKLVNGGCVDE